MNKKLFFALAVSASFTALPAMAEMFTSAASEQGVASMEFANTSAFDPANAKSRLPMLETHQLPDKVKKMLGMGDDGVVSQAHESFNHPFTTVRAGTIQGPTATIKKQPHASTGKMWMTKGGDTFVCTASVIDKSVLVTAAHCVWDFGSTAVDSISFEPARNLGITPYGSFTAIDWIVPSVYADGTDVCDVAGVVCENDIAVVVLAEKGGLSVEETVSGSYGTKAGGYGYTNFNGVQSAQITQLGYPVSLDDGLRMIRTDSMGYQETPNNVIIGSDQTGGSSGGPWLVNYGAPIRSRDSSNPAPLESAPNKVIATTSWGFSSNDAGVQGASRFGFNTTFTTQTNIDGLHDFACTTYPTACN